MRTAILTASVVALAALTTSCNQLDDPDPERLDAPLTVSAGEILVGEVRSDGHYESLHHDFDWDLDLVGLPAGFLYRTLDVWVDEPGHLWVEFELTVGATVPPNRYGFGAEYEVWNHGALFLDEVEFRFDVLVAESTGTPHTLVVQAVTELDPDGGTGEPGPDAEFAVIIGE